MVYQSLIDRLRYITLFRAMVMPVFVVKKKVDHRRYRKSEDAAYIRTLRNRHKGKRCFVIGNGPSLTVEDLNRLKGEITFACNRIYDIFPYTDWRPTYYVCIDKAMIYDMQINRTDLSGLAQSELFCANRVFVQSLKKNLKIHEIFFNKGFSIDASKRQMEALSEDVSDHVSVAHSVMCPMMELAMYMGITEIYLIGVDHNFAVEIDKDGNKTINLAVQPHFKEQKDKSIYPAYKDTITKCYEIVKKYADTHGFTIKNATRGGKLEVFERDSLENILAQ